MDSSDGLEPELDFSPTKTRASLKVDKCTFCQKDEINDPLILGTSAGIDRVLEVCKLRLSHNSHDHLSKQIQVSVTRTGIAHKWHRQCYQEFTNKNKLDRLLSSDHDSNPTQSNIDCNNWSSTAACSETFDWKSMCLFSGISCQVKSQKAHMSRVTSLKSVQDSLLNAAERRKDCILKERISGVDLNAKAAQYHRKCYQMYVSERNITAEVVRSDTSSNTYDMAFSRLLTKIDHNLIFRSAVYDMSKMLLKYRSYLKAMGVDGSDYPSHRLKERLVNHYGDRVKFQKQRNPSRPLLFMADIATETAITSALKKDNIDEDFLPEKDTSKGDSNQMHVESIFAAATILRNDLKNSEGIEISVSTDINDTIAEKLIPDSVYMFLKWLIEGTANGGDGSFNISKAENISENYHNAILSLGQDLVWLLSNGRKPTPKHIGLAMTIKHLTGSKQMVSVINRCGHCASYPTIQRFETSLAVDYITKRSEEGIVLPSNIFPGSFIQAAADNIDFQEETIDGKLTTHATSLVLYQRCLKENNVLSSKAKDLPKRVRERSLERIADYRPHIRTFSAGSRKPPATNLLDNVDRGWFLDPICNETVAAILLDQAWLFCRLCPVRLFEVDIENPEQVIPSWTAFNMYVSETSPSLSVVGYCQMIPAQATDMSTIYTVLDTVDTMMSKYGQTHSVVTFDGALYSKAKEIQWRMPDRFKYLILRLGGFHTAMVFLAVIGKRFRDSGLDDALIDSGVFAGNTVDQIFKGKHYNRGVRAHKIALEALYRLRWLALCDWYHENTTTIVDERAIEMATEAVLSAFETKIAVTESVHRLKDSITEVVELMSEFEQYNKDNVRILESLY